MSRRRALHCTVALALLACAAAEPAAARSRRHADDAASSPADAPRQFHVTVHLSQQKARSQLRLHLGALPDPELKEVPGGVELRIEAGSAFQLSGHRKLREVESIELREEDGRSVALVRFACDCHAEPARDRHGYVLNIREKPKQAAAQPAAVQPTAAHPIAPQAIADQAKPDFEQLRQTLTNKLAVLTGAGQDGRAAGGASQPTLLPPPPLPVCAAPFDMGGWKGEGGFTERLVLLRARVAQAQGAPAAMAVLAEFYLAYGLAGEAAAVTDEADVVDRGSPEGQRVQRDADIARLLRGDTVEASSGLLTNPPDCERADAGLWRALAASAAHDDRGVAQQAKAAGAALRSVPEPLLQLFAWRISEAAQDDPVVLRAMAAAVRNATVDSPPDESARFLLQARLAHLDGDADDEAAFLEHAARNRRTLPGLIAETLLAELHAAQEGPGGAQSEPLLADVARVYRDETLGQGAAERLAQRRLRQADYAGALNLADESAGADRSHVSDSRGAAMAARILRTLLVDPPVSNLPEPSERLALYWRYEGYATPGEKGDNIRLGAARTMLAQDVPAAALNLTHQFSEAFAASPEAMLVRAAAEARAGDPQVALLLLQKLPSSEEANRAGADALARMGRPAEAAHRLDAASALADRLRRATLLCDAKAWSEVAGAYADVLRDPALVGDDRREAADRYGLALALSGGSPEAGLSTVSDGLSARVLAALPPQDANRAAAGPPSVQAVRDALARAKQIETLLPTPAASPQPASPPPASPLPTSSPPAS